WLNDSFYNAAFGKDFRKRIMPNPATGDAVSLLTDDYMQYRKDRFQNYFRSYEDARCGATAYAQAGGLYPNERGFCSWWLRTPEEWEPMDQGCVLWKNRGEWMNTAVRIEDFTHPAVYSYSGVRPIIWVELDYAPVLESPKAEKAADSQPAFSQIREENAEGYLQAALAGCTFVAEGSVKSHSTRILGTDSYSPSFVTTYVLDNLTVLAGTYGEDELRIQVPGIASAFEFKEGRRYIVIAGNPQEDPEKGTVYQGLQVRCLLDAQHPDRIESLILGGYRTDFLQTRAEMVQRLRAYAPPFVPFVPAGPVPDPEPVIPPSDPLWNETLAPAPDGAPPFTSITADNATDYLRAALLDSSFVAEGFITSHQTFAAHTYYDVNNPVQWDIYELKVHHYLAGPRDETAPFSFTLVVPEGDPAGGFEEGGRYIVIINSPDSVFYPSDTLILYQAYQVRCKLAVTDSNTITQMRIGEYSADYPRTKKELEDFIELNIGLADHWYNPKDYYVHQDSCIEDVVRRSPVVARVQVQDVQDEPGTGLQICVCTIRVLADVWQGEAPAAPDQPFRIRVPWGSVWKGQVLIVCIQKHVDRIDRDGNPICLQPSHTVDVYGKTITVYDTVYEPAAKLYWVTDPYWDRWSEEKIRKAVKAGPI
ncbi:MAG: hypothetical protein II781_00050, partial [Clostridia bacterium]|nr:hypothetical protein [Clostridia bacterium]